MCGVRVRVEHATGKVRPKPWNRGGMGGGGGGGGGRGPPPRRGFDPSDRCFTCNERGHYSYDCPRSGGTRYNDRRKRYFLVCAVIHNICCKSVILNSVVSLSIAALLLMNDGWCKMRYALLKKYF